MIGQASPLATPSLARSPLVWAQTPVATVAKLTGRAPAAHEWRRFLDGLRPSSKPLLLVLCGRVWLNSAARTELARAIGTSAVAIVVDHDVGRGLATALRWAGADIHAFEPAEIARIDAALGFERGVAFALLDRLMR